MDSLLLFKGYADAYRAGIGFNPYSNGFSSFIYAGISLLGLYGQCFNPYSNGFSSFISLFGIAGIEYHSVSILILMDSLLLYFELT